ncbi:MAG TPA: hypothetical protein EYP16_04290 [Candidatus Atribacteria bacterium]|nr:hypothetical protein [Candidatus Atribacteria bacterium]
MSKLDIIIRNGTIIDGMTSKTLHRQYRSKNGKITKISKSEIKDDVKIVMGIANLIVLLDFLNVRIRTDEILLIYPTADNNIAHCAS